MFIIIYVSLIMVIKFIKFGWAASPGTRFVLEDLQEYYLQLYQMLFCSTNAWHQIVFKCKVISAPKYKLGGSK